MQNTDWSLFIVHPLCSSENCSNAHSHAVPLVCRQLVFSYTIFKFLWGLCLTGWQARCRSSTNLHTFIAKFCGQLSRAMERILFRRAAQRSRNFRGKVSTNRSFLLFNVTPDIKSVDHRNDSM